MNNEEDKENVLPNSQAGQAGQAADRVKEMTMIPKREILNLSFNQEHNLFAAAMETGVKVYNVDPLAVKANLDLIEIGSIAICELLHRSNLIAMVAGGSKPKYADNTVLIWDDAKKEFILEFTFSSAVLAVKMRKDKLVVAERFRVHVFSFPTNPKKLFTIETRDNPQGLMAVTPYSTSERQILVIPSFVNGSIELVDLNSQTGSGSASPLTIKAHDHEIACIAINKTGTMVATASSQGTLIRVYDTYKRSLFVELRRGGDKATIHCINFSHDSDFLCVSSDKGTIHIFALKDTYLNKRSRLGGFGLGQYVESQWSLVNFTVPPECAALCVFGPNSTVYAMCIDGTYHKYTFSQEGHNCNRIAYDVFLDVPEDDDF